MNTKANLSVIPVRKIQDVFVAGRKFHALQGKKLSYKELEHLPVMCLEGSTSTKTYVEEFLKQYDVQLKPEFELATSNMLIQFAVKSLGIASVVRDFAAEQLADGELFELEFESEIPQREFCIVYDEKIPRTKASEELLGHLLSKREEN